MFSIGPVIPRGVPGPTYLRCRERFCRRPLVKEFLVKKVVAAAVAAGVLSVGFAGTVQAAPHSDGWGGSARVKASKSVPPVDVNGLRRTPRM